jgi:pimeloyl-ACP methyl ester carboxylesterase
MVLVSGFGVGASAFEGFMRRNADRYHMFAVTLPGFENTAAPPMPAAGTSYGDQSWTRAAVDAVVKLIREKKLDRPVLVGHSSTARRWPCGPRSITPRW